MSAARKTTKLDTSFYERYRAERMADPEFKAEYERQSRAIAAIDEIVNRLDALRIEHDLSKAELARTIDKNPASVRRLLTAKGNPELATVVAIADALDADVVVVPRTAPQADRRGRLTSVACPTRPSTRTLSERPSGDTRSRRTVTSE